MLNPEDVYGVGKYSWHCILCNAFGYGGTTAYERHYKTSHAKSHRATYIDYLREARNEHGLNGAAAYQWAHSAWAEYERNH